jgi:aspartate-semialdehyde dehydrogenase
MRRKTLGREIDFAVSTNRVPVVDGHTAHVMPRLRREADSCKVCDVFERYQADHTVTELPSVPCRPLAIHLHYARPQPRLDAGLHGGMGVSVGRVRRVPGFNLALVVVAHNAVRGATGACLANAELIVSSRSRSSGLAATLEGGI